MRYFTASKKTNFLIRSLGVWFLIFAGFPLPGWSQQNQLKFKTLSSKDGLSSSMAWSLAQDQHGFIWVGTYDGLNRYNGYEFKVYRNEQDDPHSVSGNFISSLYYDSKNRLWIGTPTGVNLYDAEKDRFDRFAPSGKPEILSPHELWIYEDRQQTIWTGTSDGMNFLNDSTGVFEKPEMLNVMEITGSVNALLHDKAGRFWLGTGDGLYIYFPEQGSYEKMQHSPQEEGSLSSNQIYAVYEDSQGRIWIGSSGGVSLYKPESKSFENFKSNAAIPASFIYSEVRSIEEAADGNLWIGTYDGGLKKFIVASQTFESFVRDPKDPSSLADNSVKKVLTDKMGGIWIATFRGVSYANEHKMHFNHFQYKTYDPSSLTDNFVTTLFRDRQGGIWAGNRFGISRFRPDQQNFVHYIHQPHDTTSISNGAIVSISEDSKGNLWTTTHTGLIDKFDRHSERFFRYKPDPKNPGSIKERSNFVLCSKDGSIWVSFPNGVSLYHEASDSFTHYFMPESLEKGQIWFMYEDSRENIWVISWGALYLFDRKDKTFSLFETIPEELRPFQTTQIHEDANQNLWFGSFYNGLISYSLIDSTLTVYENGKDIPKLFIKGILDDENGNLWLSTNNGLYRFNPKTKEYKMYGIEDGVLNAEFNQKVCIKAANGEFWFGGHNGITVFCPDQVVQNPHPPNVAIIDFQLFNKKVPIGDDSPLKKSITETNHIDLSYRHTVLSFEFVGLNYNAPEKNQYAYRMLGFETEWNYSGTRRHASYTNLPPGKTYTFQVKASNNDGVWSPQAASVQLYIQPPFWATWWFHGLLVALLIIGLYGIYRWRTRQHYLQRRELEQKVHERTEEVESQKEKLAAHAEHLKTANKEIRRKNKKILRQSQELKALDKLKSRFLANISHEFRTPLTLIMVPLEEIMSAAKTNTEVKGRLSVVKRNAGRLLQLINQLLDLSKLENGSIPLDMQQKNVIPFLKAVCQSFETLAHKQKINFTFQSTTDKVVINFDADKLEKIMYNLLSNAFKFTPEEGTVKVCVEPVGMPKGRNNEPPLQQEYLKIGVSDTGSGISDKHLPYIFNRFYQGEPSMTRKSDGTGIGLSLTRELVELLGGSITVVSEPGQGTCFSVLLPLAKEQVVSDEGSVASAPEVAAEKPDLEEALFESYEIKNSVKGEDAPLLLLVEDNEDLRQQIKRIFCHKYRIEEAADGLEGWDKASSLSPDLIISDVMMPGKDGFEFVNQLKTTVSTSHIPTILLTARTDGEEEGLQLGADDYIVKPFNARRLELKVHNLLETRVRFREAICRELGIKPIAADSEPEGIKPADQEFIEQASQITTQHLTCAEFDTELLYRELGMSRTIVYNKLKSLTGLSPNEFIRKVRLNKASSLIVEGRLSITEVMYAVGINHRSYFVKCFKQEFGHLPSDHPKHQETLAPATAG